MRKNINTLLLLFLVPVLFFSCVKEAGDNLDDNEKFSLYDPATMAQVKFIHAYTPLTLGGAPVLSTTSNGFRITVNNTKVNGATNTSPSTNTFMYGGVFPPTTAYSFLSPGQSSFKFIMNRIVSGTHAPVTGDEVFNANVSLEAGKRYSLFIADPYPAPGVYAIEDNFPVPPRNQFAFRFVNLCGDAASRFDVISLRFGPLFTNVSYREVRDYTIRDVPTVADTIYLRTAGTNTTVSQINTFLPGAQRVYTLYARGKTGVTGRTPSITFFTNR
jgi:hypothetical protein